MKTYLFSLLVAFFISGCGVGYESTPYGDNIYMYGSYGHIVQDTQASYDYDEILYFETSYLQRGCEIYVDIYNDYSYAYINIDERDMYLYDHYYAGSDEAHYIFKIKRSGYNYFSIEDLHPQTVVKVYSGC